jgi:phage terminase large subunit-like protein
VTRLPTLQASPTKSGLLANARHLVLPDGIRSTGFPSVEATCREVGILFDPWQQELNRCILSKDQFGDYAADTVALSVCRQSGKTFDIGGIVFADSIINPGTTTVWTAHRFAVARETFNELRALASTPKMLPHVDPDAITSAAGNECIPFRNGSRILFKARERGAIRGFTKVRRLILDEAQILTDSALSDMVPTMNQADNPQIILMGTPPQPNNPSEVFTQLRSEALNGESEGVIYVEFSADPDCDSDDRAAWRQANPSYPKRTKAAAITRMRKLLGEADFRREALGIWDSDDESMLVDLGAWDSLQVPASSARPSPFVFAVEVSPSRKWASVSIAGLVQVNGEDRVALQVAHSERGTGWVADWIAERTEKWSPLAVAIDPGGPAGALIPAFAERGIEPATVSLREIAHGCGMFVDAVEARRVAHVGQDLLRISIEGAKPRRVGESWVLAPKSE